MIFLTLALLWTGCASSFGSGGQEPAEEPQGETPQPVPAQIDLTPACHNGPWIGVLRRPESGSEGARPERQEEATEQGAEAQQKQPLRCPPPWEWLFDTGSSQDPPPGLRPFCIYRGDDPRPDYRRSDNPFLGYRFFETIEQDCRILGPAAETLFPSRETAEALKRRFLQQSRGILPNPVQFEPDPVRLVVVDSVQDQADDPHLRECPATTGLDDYECSAHGEVLVKLARDLLCSGSRCAARIATRRTLHWTYKVVPESEPPDDERFGPLDPTGPVRGGSWGMPSDLAHAIRREVDAWAREDPRPALVLNLSVGWEVFHKGQSFVGARSVRAALEDAVCRGALVIAAAGNRVSGLPEVRTPLLPAAWEEIEAPSAAECRALLEPSAEPAVNSGDYRPLVFAVGGVQHAEYDKHFRLQDRLLSNGRPGATPRLLAYGDHAAVLYPGQPARYKVLTGTSVSTLVVAAAAAEAWSRDASLSPFDLMAGLRARSRQTALAADFCLDSGANCPPGTQARRVYVGSPPSQGWAVPGVQERPKFNAALLSSSARTYSPQATQAVPSCRPGRVKFQGGLVQGAELCPQRFFDIRSQPWMGPQPGSNHNPACSYTKNSPGTLVLEFSPCFRVQGKPALLEDLTLIVGDQAYRLPEAALLPEESVLPNSSNQPTTMKLGDPAEGPCPQQDDPRRIRLVLRDFVLDDPPHPMYLAATVNGKHATVTPILQVIRKGN